jgi:hypothetical protein
MEVISCKKEFNGGKRFGYTIKHNQFIGWMGTTNNYIGWYRYKTDAIKRLKELQINLED